MTKDKVELALRIEKLLTGSPNRIESILKRILRVVERIDDPIILSELDYYISLLEKIKQSEEYLRSREKEIEAQIDNIINFIKALNAYVDTIKNLKQTINQLKEINERIVEEIEKRLERLEYA